MALTAASSPAAAKYLSKHRSGRKDAHASRLPFGDIPKGPLEIFISINQQRLHFYSDGVHVADAPVATGVPGHLTPMGVFSVIQRDRYHHSNIYDNAPMPFMERITWSGVALHEGEGVGHPASHGCIRMPHDFAARLWMLPTMGMRVIIARPELRPLDFTDPHLFVHKDASTAALPVTQTAQSAPPGVKSDVIQPAATVAAPQPAAAAPAAAASAPASPPAAPQDAASAAPSAPAASAPPQADAAPGSAGTTIAAPAPAEPAAAANTSPAAAAPASPPTSTQPASTQPTSTQPAAASGPPPGVPAEAAGLGTTSGDIAAPISLDDVPLPPAKPAQLGVTSGGPIAIFISRKTSKIYVRQNFTPLFDAPVKIDNPSQPLGTHVFTAMDYLADHSAFHWTVVTLPATAPKAEHWKYVRDAWGRRKRVRVAEPQQEAATPQDTPEEALARIQIPQDIIDQISQLIVPGSSLVVSDQGLGPETGEGTDFIVVTR